MRPGLGLKARTDPGKESGRRGKGGLRMEGGS